MKFRIVGAVNTSRRRPPAVPERFRRLAQYNDEVARGLVHTPAWKELMAVLQQDYWMWVKTDLQPEDPLP